MHYRQGFSLKASHFACVLCLAQQEREGGVEEKKKTPGSTACVLMEAGESEMDCQPS